MAKRRLSKALFNFEFVLSFNLLLMFFSFCYKKLTFYNDNLKLHLFANFYFLSKLRENKLKLKTFLNIPIYKFKVSNCDFKFKNLNYKLYFDL